MMKNTSDVVVYYSREQGKMIRWFNPLAFAAARTNTVYFVTVAGLLL